MNSAVHTFCKLAKFYHITDVLMDFHCLPVRQRSLNSNLSGLRTRKVAPIDYIYGGHLGSRGLKFLIFLWYRNRASKGDCCFGNMI